MYTVLVIILYKVKYCTLNTVPYILMYPNNKFAGGIGIIDEENLNSPSFSFTFTLYLTLYKTWYYLSY